MHEYTDRIADSLLSMEQDLKGEFERSLSENSTLAFRVAFSVLRHAEDAEDVAQEAFTRAYRNFRHLRDRNRFRAWLVRMTWRLAIDRRRSNQRRMSRDSVGEPAPMPETPIQSVIAMERTQQLWKAIDSLPDKLRLVTILAGIEEHDVLEVAALLRLPEGTVKSRLFLARQRLKEFLQ